MGKNILYVNEIATANQFIIDHSNDIKLQYFLHNMELKKDLIHSDRWSMCYDFLKEHYPEATGTIITGLSYWLED